MKKIIITLLMLILVSNVYGMEIKKPFVIKVMGYCDCVVRLEVPEKETFSYFIRAGFSDVKENISIKIGKDEYCFFERDYPPCEWKKLKDFLVNVYYNL